MDILSCKLSHDGAIANLRDDELVFSIEAEKNSSFRYSDLSLSELVNILGVIEAIPDVFCLSGWWLPEVRAGGSLPMAGYRGISEGAIITGERRFLGKKVRYFSSSHERSHLMCAYGMSELPKGTPSYALVWEGVIGSFYEIDSALNITLLADVMSEPGHRYALLYGFADPTFPKTSGFSRLSDAGKLMAIAAYSNRRKLTAEEERLTNFLLQRTAHLEPKACEALRESRYYDIGHDDKEFRNFAGIFHDKIFDIFYQYAKSNMKKRLPLLISGGCGLNCDWNTRWLDSGLFSSVFVPPVANDSGSAIGTAIDARYYYTRDPKINWSVYAGLEFVSDDDFDSGSYDVYEATADIVSSLLADDLVLGWVQGKFEIGPRALGNRSILAAPFSESTKIRLNEIKGREQFRPIAPVCLEEDAALFFGCSRPSPYMLYTQKVTTDALGAVTHVDRTARIQTVSRYSNAPLYELLVAFKARTGYGVLCNTSLNFNGRGFINNIGDLSKYVLERKLDGFVVANKCYLRRDLQFHNSPHN
jgi:predicted NodU family carbamoyl transferase